MTPEEEYETTDRVSGEVEDLATEPKKEETKLGRLKTVLQICAKPARRIWNKLCDDPLRNLSYLLFWFTPVICFLMVELLAENNPFTGLHLWQWVMNLVWYTFILFVGWLITGRKKGAMLLTVFFSFLIGISNHYALEFRGRALFPIDLIGWKTAVNVAGNYSFAPDGYVIGAAAIVAAMCLVQLILPKQKKRGKEPWLKWFKILVSVGWTIYIILFFFTGILQDMDIYAQQWKTKGNGFLLNFTVSAHYMMPEKPDGYSTEAAEELIAQLESEGCTSDSASDAKEPVTNFIVIMNESFADMTEFESLTLSKDPTPFLHSFTENAVKGDMITSVTGGGTAAVEFEALTGNTMNFLPTGTVAYQLYVTSNISSLARVAGSMGISSSAYHPYESSGWNRTTAYRFLGFDSQYYLDQVINGDAFGTEYEDDEIIREYVSDSADYSRIYEITRQAEEQGKSCFVFNVTMQNHSGYTKEWNNLYKYSELTGKYAGKGYDNSSAQYFALMHESDKALQELIEYYSSVDEKTVILFFGDHQPPLKNDLYTAIYGKDLDERTDAEVIEQYKTPFFIWTNYDSEESDGMQIGTNYLGVMAAKAAGYPQTGYMKFLERMNESFAATTRVGYVMTDGRITTEASDLSEEEQQLLKEYEYLQYFNLFDDGADNAFFNIGE